MSSIGTWKHIAPRKFEWIVGKGPEQSTLYIREHGGVVTVSVSGLEKKIGALQRKNWENSWNVTKANPKACMW